MDYYQGSIPLHFIPFGLENQMAENLEAPTPSQAIEPVKTVIADDGSGKAVSSNAPAPPPLPDFSPLSQDSEQDVTAYAESVVEKIERAERTSQLTAVSMSSATPPQDLGLLDSLDASLNQGIERSSTPISSPKRRDPVANLSGLESVLHVATTLGSQLPELRLTSDLTSSMQEQVPDPAGEDTTTSVQDAPALPSGRPKTYFPPSHSGQDSSAEDTSHFDVFELYGRNPVDMESGTDGGDELGFCTQHQGPSGARIPGVPVEIDGLPQLSGRSRALLKQYFEENKAFRLPVVHPTVAFTETQVYNLLRVLTDETLRMSYSTMERMVLDAVRGTPAVAPSRTAHFQSRGRAQTPARRYGDESSMSETDSDPNTQTGADSSGGTGESSFLGESDSATEMALISETFRQAPTLPQASSFTVVHPSEQRTIETENSGVSSQDATLLEIQEKTKEAKDQKPVKSKKQKRERRAPQRGIPMREEFFAKIGWTRSFISVPADPLHNPLMVWCHMCKKNFSIKTKGAFEILRHHRSERHLRRDQRWRYEHLKSTDPVSGRIQHRVRGRNGKLLTKIELAKELPKFIHAELVDVGERFPFYEDFIKGTTTVVVTPESRSRTQLCLIGDFIHTHGNLSVLRNLWARVGSYTNHQAAFCDFDWSEERLSVSTII